MPGDVEAEHFFFVGQLIFGEPIGNFGQRFLGMLFGGELAAEQACLPAETVLPGALAALDGGIHCRE